MPESTCVTAFEPLYGNSDAKAHVVELIEEIRLCDDESRYPELLAQVSCHCPSFIDQYDLLKLFESYPFPPLASEQAHSVAQFYYRAGNGGIERTLVELASTFDAAGKRSLAITNIPRDESCYDAAEGVQWATITEFHVENMTRERVESHLRDLLELIRANQVDVLVHHAWLSLQCCWDLLLCRLLGVRFVYVSHGVFSYPLTLTSAERACFALVPRIVALSDAVVCLSEANRQYYLQFNDNVFFIPDPVSSDVAAWVHGAGAQSNELGRAESRRKTVLWVGRFDDQKRPIDAVRIMKRVANVVPGARLVFVGKSEDGSYERMIGEAVSAEGAASIVEMKGYTTNVEEYYRDADALLFTTEIEGYGLVLIEAAAAGLPVVMYDLPYLATAGCDSWIAKAPLYDIEAAARELIAILGDDGKRAAMSRAASDYFETMLAYDFAGAWEIALTCPSPNESSFQISGGQEVLWNAIYDHCLQGSVAIGRLFTENDVAIILNEQRREFETSTSWRVGRAVTALPRKLLGR